jgi:hypothetical protein
MAGHTAKDNIYRAVGTADGLVKCLEVACGYTNRSIELAGGPASGLCIYNCCSNLLESFAGRTSSGLGPIDWSMLIMMLQYLACWGPNRPVYIATAVQLLITSDN